VSRFSSIIKQIEASGWEVSNSDIPDEFSWAVNIYALKSTWHPVGLMCYMTMIVDVGRFYSSFTEDDVEQIILTHNFPKSWGDGNIINIKRKFQERTSQIPNLLDKMRDLKTPTN